MKTAGRENPNRWTILSRNRAHGAVSQNRSRSIRRAAKQEKFRPREGCFFLTSTFIELGLASLAACGHVGKPTNSASRLKLPPGAIHSRAKRPVNPNSAGGSMVYFEGIAAHSKTMLLAQCRSVARNVEDFGGSPFIIGPHVRYGSIGCKQDRIHAM